MLDDAEAMNATEVFS